MDSDTDSIITTSTSISNDPKPTRGISAHTTWAHSRPAGEGETAGQKYCIHCKGPPIYSTSVTTNLRNHLRTKHNIHVETSASLVQQMAADRLKEAFSRGETPNETIGETETQIFKRRLRQDVLDDLLISMVTENNISFRLAESSSFHAFCQLLNPLSSRCVTTAHSEVAKKLSISWQSQRDIVQKKTQSSLSNVHLSLDIWTSPNRYSFLGICAHFVEVSQEKLSKALLALRRVANHSGEEQFDVLLPVLKEYGIVRKLGSIVGDNATTNDTLCRAVSRYMKESENLDWKPDHKRISCIGHVINLAVQAFLMYKHMDADRADSYDHQEASGRDLSSAKIREEFRSLGPLGKLHNIVVHIRNSTGRTARFRELAGRMIPLDNRTRWNSWHGMLRVSLKLANAVDAYSKEYFDDLEDEYLSPSEWEALREITDFLAVFHEATLETQGDRATIDRVLFTMDILIKHFEESIVST